MEDWTTPTEEDMRMLKEHPMYQPLMNADYCPRYTKDCKEGDYVVIPHPGITIAGVVDTVNEDGAVVADNDVDRYDIALVAPKPKWKVGDIIAAKYGDDPLVLLVSDTVYPAYGVSAYEEAYELSRLEDIKIIMTEEEALNHGRAD